MKASFNITCSAATPQDDGSTLNNFVEQALVAGSGNAPNNGGASLAQMPQLSYPAGTMAIPLGTQVTLSFDIPNPIGSTTAGLKQASQVAQ